MSNPFVLPQSDYFLTLLQKDGNGDLREYLIELNQEYSQYEVRSQEQTAALNGLDSIRERIKRAGVDNPTMIAVESMVPEIKLHPHYPVETYTLAPSRTNLNIALEEIDKRQVLIGGAIGLGALAILYKMVKWIIKFFKKDKDISGDAVAAVEKRQADADMASEAARMAGTSTEEIIRKSKNSDPVVDLWNENYTAFIDQYRHKNIIETFKSVADDIPNYLKLIKMKLDVLENGIQKTNDLISNPDSTELSKLETEISGKLSQMEEEHNWSKVKDVIKKWGIRTDRNNNMAQDVRAISQHLNDLSNRKVPIRPRDYERVKNDLGTIQISDIHKTWDEIVNDSISELEEIQSRLENAEKLNNALLEETNKSEPNETIARIIKMIGNGFNDFKTMQSAVNGLIMIHETIYGKIATFYERVIHRTTSLVMTSINEGLVEVNDETKEAIEKLKKSRDSQQKND